MSRFPVRNPEQHEKDQASADKEAASRREAEVSEATRVLAAHRAAEDEEIAERRRQEDTALAEARREADRQVASARTRLVAAAAAHQDELDKAGTPGYNVAELRVTNAELQAAIEAHLSVTPETIEVTKPEG